MIGRSSSARIRSIACSTYYDKLSLTCNDRTRLGSIINILVNFIKNGGLSWMIGISGEVFGVLLLSPLMACSLGNEKNYPLNASFCFHAFAALCVTIYVASFTLDISNQSSFYRKHKGSNISFIRQVIFESVSEVKVIIRSFNGHRQSEETSKCE